MHLVAGQHLVEDQSQGVLIAGLAEPALEHLRGAVARVDLGGLLPRWWHRLTPGHRRCTHSLVAVGLVGLLLHLALGALGVSGYALELLTALVVVGMLSHLAADAITDHGVPLFWPWRQHFGLPLFRTGSLQEHVVVFLVVAGTAWWAFGLGDVVQAARGHLA